MSNRLANNIYSRPTMISVVKIILCFAGFWSVYGNAFAQSDKVSRSDSVAGVVNHTLSIGYTLKLISALIIVLLFFYVFSRLMKSVQGGMGPGNGALSIVSTVQVGSKEKIVMLQAGDRQFVVGVTAGSINTLAELNGELHAPENHNNRFKKKLKTLMRET